jgi:hypothetical protein
MRTLQMAGSINGLPILHFSGADVQLTRDEGIFHEIDLHVLDALRGTFHLHAGSYFGGEAAFNPALSPEYPPCYRSIDLLVVGGGPYAFAKKLRGDGRFNGRSPILDELKRETGYDFEIRETKSNDTFRDVAFTEFNFSFSEGSNKRFSPISLSIATRKAFEENLY